MSTGWLVVAALAVFAVAPWVLITMRPSGAPTLDDWRAGRVDGGGTP